MRKSMLFQASPPCTHLNPSAIKFWQKVKLLIYLDLSILKICQHVTCVYLERQSAAQVKSSKQCLSRKNCQRERRLTSLMILALKNNQVQKTIDKEKENEQKHLITIRLSPCGKFHLLSSIALCKTGSVIMKRLCSCKLEYSRLCWCNIAILLEYSRLYCFCFVGN